ncbi:MAG TPA: hypothetical protein VHP83_25185 [Aggregatilineaceae bacterium]|nr:hypothetical protein [Aggregatilineaceae bacterium]
MNLSLTKWMICSCVVMALILGVYTNEPHPASAVQQSTECPPVVDVEGITSSERLYFMVYDIYRDTPLDRVVQIWFIDGEGQHDTGVRVPFPSATNRVRARLSLSGERMALFFFFGEGDPPNMSGTVVLTLIDLLSGTTENYSLNLQAQSYGSLTATYPDFISSYYTEFSDLLWAWLDNDTIVFNQSETRFLFDTESGRLSPQAWPNNPWGSTTDAWRLGGPSGSRFGFYGRFASAFPVRLHLKAVDLANGSIALDDLLVDGSGLSFSEDGTQLIFKSPQNELVVHNLHSGEQIAAAIPESEQAIFDNAGYFVSSNDSSTIMLHISPDTPLLNGQVYLVKMGASGMETVSLCLRGETDYGFTRPAWSADGHYVFTLLTSPNEEILTETYVYDARHHVLERVIDNAQYESYLAQGLIYQVVGWE